MAIDVSKADGNTTLTFSITGTSTKVDPLLDKWAEYAYKAGFGQVTTTQDDETVVTDYSDLTNAQKMAAINARIKAVGLAEANAQLDKDAKAEVAATKETYDLDGISE